MAAGGGTSEPAATETPSEDSDAACCRAPEVAVETDNKQPETETQTENSSGAVDVGGTAGEPLDGPCEEPTTDTSEASREPPLAHAPVEDGASEGGCDKLEGPVCPRSDPPARPPSAESREGQRQGRVRRSRRSSARSLQPLERDPDPAGALQEEGAAAGAELAPWQADFNLEDVFKPVASRGQRSVRRSLRNQRRRSSSSISNSSSSSSAGLAWLPQTPPDSIGGGGAQEAQRPSAPHRSAFALRGDVTTNSIDKQPRFSRSNDHPEVVHSAIDDFVSRE